MPEPKVIDNKAYIPICSARYPFHGEEMLDIEPFAIIYRNAELEKVAIKGTALDEQHRYLCLDSDKAFTNAQNLKDSLKEDSLALICNLALAIQAIDNRFPGYLGWKSSSLALSSIFFSQDKEVLILGAKVQALMQSSNDHEYNEAMSDVWQVYDRPEETGKAIWLASLVYYAIAGKPYFLDRQQREPLPLSLYFNESNRISSIVDAMLQEKGSVNDGAGAFLESFAEIAQKPGLLTW